MKKTILILLFKGVISYSQIAIGCGGNTLPQFAQLEIISQDKGVLLPRVALVSTTSSMPINSNPATIPNSLLVYNTETQNDVVPGYYFWLDMQWNKVVTQYELNTSFTSNNGVIRNDNNFKLGGKLINPVTINTNGQHIEIKGTTANTFSVDNGTRTTLSVDAATNRVGIGIKNPIATLDVLGAIATKEDILTLYGDTKSVAIPTNSGQVAIKGGTKNFSITPPEGPIVAGQRLIIYNDTNYIGTFINTTIHSKQAIEFIYSNSDWRSTSPINNVSKIYIGQAIIPPHNSNYMKFKSEKYDTTDWKILESEGKDAMDIATKRNNIDITFSKMDITYLYKGNDSLELKKVYPILRVRAKSPNTFIANLIEIKEKENKIKLKVSITRIDKSGDTSANWNKSFTLDIILINPI